MGKPTGFMDYEREEAISFAVLDRVKNNKEFHLLLSKEKQQIQASRCMNCGIPFCQAGIHIKNQPIGCPSLNLIPEWNDLLSKGHWKSAFARLNSTMPFPEITGRICPAPCEIGCVCTANGEAVTIKDNELALAEYAFKNNLIKEVNVKKNGKKIAVIGSGPAGLACANELNLRGYEVSVFEKDDMPGGLLMYGIPDVKLEKSVVMRRISVMKRDGIKFFMNQNIDSKEKILDLLSKFDRVVLALGAGKSKKIEVDRRNLKGVIKAMDFLTNHTKDILNKDKDKKKNILNMKDKNIVIVGSGDTSTDCVAVALRQGAKSITRLERSAKRPLKRSYTNPWPEAPVVNKEDYGIEEAKEIYGNDIREFLTIVKELKGKDKLSGVVTSKIEWNYINNIRKSTEVLNSKKEIKADFLIEAIGFSGCEDLLQDEFSKIGIEFENDLVKTNDFRVILNLKKSEAYKNYINKIYVCGDCKIGPSLVVTAIKEGVECAKKLDYDFFKHI